MIGPFKNPATRRVPAPSTADKFGESLASDIRPAATQEGVSNALYGELLSLQRAVGNRAVSHLVCAANDRGSGFQAIHIHTGKEADARTEAQGAVAFASGRDVYLESGIDLGTGFGQHVLAHELTHVIQQERGRVGLPQGSQASLESEANYVSGLSRASSVDVGGAAAPGSVQKLEKQGIPVSPEEKRRWEAEVEADAQKLSKILSSAFYSDDDETEVIAILNRWAMRQSESERKGAVKEAGSSDQGTHFGMRSDYLDRLFDRLRSTSVWTRYGRTTAYEAMVEYFDRAQEVRTIRDTYSIKYVGREEKADKAREGRGQEDLLGESLFGWQANRFEPAPSATSPHDKYQAALVIKRLQELRPDQMTPKLRLLSEGVAREGGDFLLKRTHVVTAGDKLRTIKRLAQGAVVTMLEFALWELGIAAVEAVVPDLLAGLGGAEAAGAERAAREGEIGAKTGVESRIAKEVAPEALEQNVTSIVGRPRTGTIEGLKGDGEVIDFPGAKSKSVPEPTPPTPAGQVAQKTANEDVEVGLANETQLELGMKKAAGAEGQTAEPVVSMAGKKTKSTTMGPTKPSTPKIEMTEPGQFGDVKVDPRVAGGASEVAQLDQLGDVTKLNNWFKTLDAHYGGASRMFVEDGKVIVEFTGGTGVSVKTTTLTDAATNLAYLQRKMNEAAAVLNEFTTWKRTESGVTHVVSDLEGRELHLIFDQEAVIENERQLNDVMTNLAESLKAEDVEFRWYVDTLEGRFEGPRWYERYLKSRKIIEDY